LGGLSGRHRSGQGQDRGARGRADHEAKVTASDKPPGGKAPNPPGPGARAGGQINLTDGQSRIMPVAGGGFEPRYNASAMVDAESILVVVPRVTHAANDKDQVGPMLEKLQALPEGLNQPERLTADAGYFGAANVDTCAAAGIEPLRALKRDQQRT
jgi:hypothetical protein